MNRVITTLLQFCLCLTCAALFAGASAAGAASKTVVIHMTAKRYEFNPSVINVKQGEHVRLIVTALDRTHGIKIPGYGINRRLNKGAPVTIEFTANKAGTFPFHCSVWCGFGHRRMKGKLIVKPANGG